MVRWFNLIAHGSIIVILIGLILMEGWAQERAPMAVKAPDVKFDIKKYKIEVVNYDDDFPNIPGIPSGRKLRFLMLLVEYAWDATDAAKQRFRKEKENPRSLFMERLEASWHVLFAGSADGKAVKPTKSGFDIDLASTVRSNLKVTYSNVNNTGTHYALVFIIERDINRYFNRFIPDNLFVQVVFRVEGQEIARLAAQGQNYAVAVPADGDKGMALLAKYLPRRSSAEPDLHFSDRISSVKGLLIPRNRSPWALSQWDVFEQIIAVSDE